MVSKQTLLLVDDEAQVRQALKRALRSENYLILEADSGAQGLGLLANNHVDVVISDQRMPEMCGSEFLAQVQLRWPNTVRLLLSGYTDFAALSASINSGAIFKFLTKPWDNGDISKHIASAFELSAQNRQKNNLQAFFNQSKEAMLTTNSHGDVQTMNFACQQLLDELSDTASSVSLLSGFNLFGDFLNLDVLALQEIANTLTSSKQIPLGTSNVWQHEMSVSPLSSLPYTLQISITALKGNEDKQQGYTAILRNMTERQLLDDITGLPSKRTLLQKMRDYLSQESNNLSQDSTNLSQDSTNLSQDSTSDTRLEAALILVELPQFDSLRKRLGYPTVLSAGHDQTMKGVSTVCD